MSSADTRAHLAEQQAALVRSLVADGDALPGFDAQRIEAAAAALASKRRREVAHTWPGLARALGDRFVRLFDEYAGQAPMPTLGGPRADGRSFARFLAQINLLTDEGRLEALQVDMHFKITPDGLIRRQGSTLQIAWLRTARRLVVALRLPLLGERCWRIPS